MINYANGSYFQKSYFYATTLVPSQFPYSEPFTYALTISILIPICNPLVQLFAGRSRQVSREWCVQVVEDGMDVLRCDEAIARKVEVREYLIGNLGIRFETKVINKKISAKMYWCSINNEIPTI